MHFLPVARTRTWVIMPVGAPQDDRRIAGDSSECVYRPREYLGDDTERCAATYRFYRNRPRPKRENPQVRMLGYWLDEAHWGKGYMTEAVQAILNYGFNELQLSLITANCYPHNKRSQQVLERNGFIYEGVLHQAELTYNGNIFDHLCYYLPNICQPAPQDYDEILEVWEASVRHTHHSSRKNISSFTSHWCAIIIYRR